MKTDDGLKTNRRNFLRAAAAGLALGALPYTARVASGADKGLKIGIIGSGRIHKTRRSNADIAAQPNYDCGAGRIAQPAFPGSSHEN